MERDAGDTAEAIAAATEQIGAAGRRRSRRRTTGSPWSTDPSYATYFGAANVSAEKATLINRVNQVYMDDLAIQFLLVANNDLLNLDTAALATTAGRSLRCERLLHRRPSSQTGAPATCSTATCS